VIAEGEQRTPEGYGSRLRPLDCFFGFPTGYVAAEEGGHGLANPVHACRMAGMCHIRGVIAPSSQWVALASAGVGRSELPAPVRIVPSQAPRGFRFKADIGVWMVFICSQPSSGLSPSKDKQHVASDQLSRLAKTSPPLRLDRCQRLPFVTIALGRRLRNSKVRFVPLVILEYELRKTVLQVGFKALSPAMNSIRAGLPARKR